MPTGVRVPEPDTARLNCSKCGFRRRMEIPPNWKPEDPLVCTDCQAAEDPSRGLRT